ncbi:hypothetical protein E3N88_22289 [Mikania micrantha]|uniref:Myb-like domain-containing protein n=1 Tax=Mikania micrantha TaxID=192012 RepID=A0A5N6NCL5_9ASTR|nr:hypothetical protein E3N88_22289 [Mikania micrantha]
MVTKPSSDATAMAWNWVIQSIARFKQVDCSTLAGLVEKAPAISVDMGKDAKEMVSLRILESLFLQGNEDMVHSDSAKNSFDPSEHCVDVLQNILKETSESITKLERRKWNIRPFMLQKRASLPKTPMQKFKEVLLEDNHLILESLKKMSNLGSEKVSENTIPEVDVYFNVQTEHKNRKLQESPLHKTDHVEDSYKLITGGGIKENEMVTESSVKDLEKNTYVDHVEHITSENHEQSCDHANIEHGQQQFTSEDDDGGGGDERTDIAAKKEAFLSSQRTLSQDFMATIDYTEIYLCMKCSKGGQLLVCSSDACPFRVHESCLGSAATFDENETFFCPFCSYSHAISKYLEVKKKATLARQDLQVFLSSGVKHRPTTYVKKGTHLNETISTQIGATGQKFKSNGNEHAMSSGKDYAPADSLYQSTCQAGMAKQPSKEKESPGSSTHGDSKRTRKQEPHYSSAITLARRKNLFWDKSEEEILKEGVQRFCCANNKRIPWKKILDFGRDVFDKSRTDIDLKDKWRNICKENPALKKQKL